MPDEIRESYCEPCLRRGHNCMTTNQVDNRYICVFCEDGVPCPVSERKKKVCWEPGCTVELHENNKTGRCDLHSGTRAARKKRQAAAPAEVEAPAPKKRKNATPWGKFGSLGLNKSTESESTTMEETKACRHPECDIELAGNNKSGVCTKHWYWGKKNPANGAAAAPRRVTRAAKAPKSTPRQHGGRQANLPRTTPWQWPRSA